MVDPGDVQDAKSRQRSALRAILANMSPTERDAASAAICQSVEARLGSQLDAGFMGYIPMPGEPDVHSLLETRVQHGSPACAPRVDWDAGTMAPARLTGLSGDDLVEGRHGVLEPRPGEPVALASLSVVLVPGLGFDEQGYRIGRGGGFYDRFLPNLPPATVIVGIAFDCQVIAAVETGPTDFRLPMIITETRVIEPAFPST